MEFRSSLENIVVAEELCFDASPGFGEYAKFLNHAVGHPAKMNTLLLEFLVKRFTCVGDVVLDPMAGSGSLGVVASLNNRNAVQVELEQKFFNWMEEARLKLEKTQTLAPKGSIRNFCGDSRRLSEILAGSVDSIVTSPPYAESEIAIKQGNDVYPEGRKKRRAEKDWSGYSSSKSNIGNLRYVDAVVTSPPYSDSKKGGDANEDAMAERWDKVAKDRDWNSWGKTWKTEGRKRALKSLGSGYSESDENIGNLRHGEIDAVITSPPYEGSLEGSTRHTKGGIASRDPKLAQSGTFATVMSFGVPVGYSANKDNIGNLKKETYLEAMLQVYVECYKVLKPSGLCVIVVKPFIRNKKVIDLPLQTWLLLERVGFKLHQLLKFRLPSESFWRVLYRKKHPDVETLAHEYIIIVQKKITEEMRG